jgi:ketosteroid isomerase-like protein
MLKQIWILCLAAALVGSGTEMARAQGATERRVMELDRELANAYVKGDTAVVDRLEAVDYVFTGPNGGMTGKGDDISDLKSGNFRAEAIELSDLKVHLYGKSAIVTGKATLKNCKYRGSDISGDYRFTDVWAETGGAWQVVASQTSALARR